MLHIFLGLVMMDSYISVFTAYRSFKNYCS